MKKIIYVLLLCGILCAESTKENPENDEEYLIGETSGIDFKSDSSKDILTQIETIAKEAKNKVSLKDLLQAANSNYSLQAQIAQVQASKKNVAIAKASLLPRFDIDYAYQYTYNKISGSMNYGERGNYSAQVGHAQFQLDLFSGFSTLNSIREKKATYRSSVADMEYAKQQIYLQVIQQYYSYFNNLSQLLSLRHKLEDTQSDAKRVEKLYASGLSTIDDLESLRSQVASTEYQIADMRVSIEENILMLKYLTNLEFDGLIRENISNPTIKQNQERMDILSLKEQIKAQKYLNKQYNYYPTITLADTYTWYIQKPDWVNDPSIASYVSYMYPTHGNVVSLTVTLRLLDDISLTLQKQYIRLGQLTQEKQLAYKQAEKNKDEALYRKRIEVAQSQIKSAQASLKSANASFDNVRKKYSNQLVNFTDYLRALSTKYDAEATYSQSLNNYELQKANYIFYSGQQIQDFVK